MCYIAISNVNLYPRCCTAVAAELPQNKSVSTWEFSSIVAFVLTGFPVPVFVTMAHTAHPRTVRASLLASSLLFR